MLSGDKLKIRFTFPTTVISSGVDKIHTSMSCTLHHDLMMALGNNDFKVNTF